MNNFTTNTYEMKREILNFSKKMSESVNKATTKFVMDMQYARHFVRNGDIDFVAGIDIGVCTRGRIVGTGRKPERHGKRAWHCNRIEFLGHHQTPFLRETPLFI